MKQSITFLLLFLVQFCHAQDYWVNYTENYRVNDVAEVDNGFWLSSKGGLCNYNTETGEETYYNRGNSNIPSNSVSNIVYQSDEEIWLSTGGGLCLFDGSEFELVPGNVNGILRTTLDDKLIVVGGDSLYIQEEGMEFNGFAYPNYIAGVGGVEVDQETGAIYLFVNNWFAESYLAVLQNGEWTVLFSDMIYDSSMTMDNDNKLWLINLAGLQYFEDGNWVVVPEADLGEEIRFARLFTNNENEIVILNQFECSKVSVWDGISLEELNYYEGDCPEFEYFIKPSDRESGVYYASKLHNGFYSFTKDEIGDYKRLTQSPILHNSVLNTLHPADDSHIVIFYNGIQQIKSGVWSEISLPDDLSGWVKKGFLDPDDNLWIFNDEFLWSYNNEEWTKLLPPTEITDNLELMEIGANGDIWIQSELNIARYRDGVWKVYKAIHHHITVSIIRDIKVDPTNGDLWVSTFQGLRQFDGQSWINHNAGTYDRTNAVTFGNEVVYAISVNNLRILKDGELDSIPFPMTGILSHTSFKMVYNNNDDKLYLAGLNSFSVYENEEWIDYNNQNSGLNAGLFNDVSIDNNDNIWLSGNNGGIGIFNSAGISLSIAEEVQEKENMSLIKIYPTLLAQDRFFIESETTGAYKIIVSDLTGKTIYEGQHQLIKNVPEEIEISYLENNLLLVTVSNDTQKITEKILKVGQ